MTISVEKARHLVKSCASRSVFWNVTIDEESLDAALDVYVEAVNCSQPRLERRPFRKGELVATIGLTILGQADATGVVEQPADQLGRVKVRFGECSVFVDSRNLLYA